MGFSTSQTCHIIFNETPYLIFNEIPQTKDNNKSDEWIWKEQEYVESGIRLWTPMQCHNRKTKHIIHYSIFDGSIITINANVSICLACSGYKYEGQNCHR